jgi:hypothetical protein
MLVQCAPQQARFFGSTHHSKISHTQYNTSEEYHACCNHLHEADAMPHACKTRKVHSETHPNIKMRCCEPGWGATSGSLAGAVWNSCFTVEGTATGAPHHIGAPQYWHRVAFMQWTCTTFKSVENNSTHKGTSGAVLVSCLRDGGRFRKSFRCSFGFVPLGWGQHDGGTKELPSCTIHGGCNWIQRAA